MITVEPIQNFDGFGTGQTQSEYYYSQGMCRTQFGMTPNWNSSDEVTSATLSGMGLITWFSGTSVNIFGMDTAGVVYGAPISTFAWTKQYTPFIANHGNGMIVDQTGRVLIAGDRYLTKWDGSTANYSVGSVSATNGSPNINGSGTTFTAGMVGKQISISGVLYTILTFTDATHIVLSANFAGTTGGGFSIVVYMGATEQWKDFGSSFQITGFRPMDIYEDWVVIGNGNAIAVLNVTDDSFTNQGLTLPSGYNVQAIRAGLSGLLVGVNVNNRGAIFLWDAVSNGSISEWIWFNGNIKAIVPTNEGSYGYYVITTRGIYLTNGYIVQPVYEQMPDDRFSTSNLLGNTIPQGVTLVGNYLILLGGGSLSRSRSGVYIFNLQKSLFEFAPVTNNVQFNLSLGAVFYDGASVVHFSYQSSLPSVTAIANIGNSSPASAFYITEPKGITAGKDTSPANEKSAEGVKWTITENLRRRGTSANTYTVAVKVYNFRRPLWNFAQTIVGSNPNTLLINGTIFTGNQVGDEVTILQGVNAGQACHITAIAGQGTSTETWTLDTTFGVAAEANVELSVCPFLKTRSYTFTNIAQLRDVYFDIGSKYKGKRFLLKLLFTGMSNTELDISDGQFIYSDQGLLTS